MNYNDLITFRIDNDTKNDLKILATAYTGRKSISSVIQDILWDTLYNDFNENNWCKIKSTSDNKLTNQWRIYLKNHKN